MDDQVFASCDAALRARLAACDRILRDLGHVGIAFSAGVDSRFLLAMALRALGPGLLARVSVSRCHRFPFAGNA